MGKRNLRFQPDMCKCRREDSNLQPRAYEAKPEGLLIGLKVLAGDHFTSHSGFCNPSQKIAISGLLSQYRKTKTVVNGSSMGAVAHQHHVGRRMVSAALALLVLLALPLRLRRVNKHVVGVGGVDCN